MAAKATTTNFPLEFPTYPFQWVTSLLKALFTCAHSQTWLAANESWNIYIDSANVLLRWCERSLYFPSFISSQSERRVIESVLMTFYLNGHDVKQFYFSYKLEINKVKVASAILTMISMERRLLKVMVRRKQTEKRSLRISTLLQMLFCHGKFSNLIANESLLSLGIQIGITYSVLSKVQKSLQFISRLTDH